MPRNANSLLALVLVVGCNRGLAYPYPVTKAHVEGLVAIADEAVKQCDVLLENDDCYQGESFSDLDDPAVPMPKEPLDGDPLLKYLWLECKRGDDKTCKSKKYDTGAPHGSGVDCRKEVLSTRGKVTAPDRGNFEQLF